jgi:uncharacterized protein
MNERRRAIGRVEAWVRDTLAANGKTAHGWLHTDRVRRNAVLLARAEGVDPVLAELAALLHDVGRTQQGPETEHGARSAAMAGPVLVDLPLTKGEREAVLYAVRWHNSGRGDTPLLCVLRDADMLDGLGAIGIMRAFMSKNHLPPYDPSTPFEGDGDCWPSLYCSDQVLGQMEWYRRFNTDAARELAEDRVAFMSTFIAQARQELRMNDQ